jgi:hypothetical protein
MDGEAIRAAKRDDREIEDIAISQMNAKLNEDEIATKAEVLEMKAQ